MRQLREYFSVRSSSNSSSQSRDKHLYVTSFSQCDSNLHVFICGLQISNPRTDMIKNQKLLLFSCWPSLFLIVTSIQQIIIYNIIIKIILIDTMPSMDSLHYHSLLILSLVHLLIHLHVWHTCMPSMYVCCCKTFWSSCDRGNGRWDGGCGWSSASI